MNPDAVKPAGLPSADNLAVPPPNTLDPMLANEPTTPAKSSEKKPTEPNPSNINTTKSNVGLAIVATIIIVLGIAALAVYAYLKQS